MARRRKKRSFFDKLTIAMALIMAIITLAGVVFGALQGLGMFN